MVSISKETSAIISRQVSILWIKPLIESNGPSKLFINLLMSPQIGWFFKSPPPFFWNCHVQVTITLINRKIQSTVTFRLTSLWSSMSCSIKIGLKCSIPFPLRNLDVSLPAALQPMTRRKRSIPVSYIVLTEWIDQQSRLSIYFGTSWIVLWIYVCMS